MPRPLTKTDVVERLHVHPLESYALIANVAKGIALGVGSLVLIQILSHLGEEWLRLLPWTASMAGVLISYTKWTRGTILSNARANVWDSCFPLMMGVAEFVLFAILIVGDERVPSSVWLNWPVCVAAHSLIATAVVSNRLTVSDPTDFAPELRELGTEYRRWLRADRAQAGASGLFALLLWSVGRYWILPSCGVAVWTMVVGGFAALCFIAAWKPILDANAQLKRIDEFVTTLHDLSATRSATE